MVKKVLVVDDEQDIRDSIAMLIETIGCEVKKVDNGNKAIEMLKKEKFDLVLLDILMPKISGIATLEKIRADPKLKPLKVVFLTVVSLNSAGKKVVGKLKPIDYIEKPINNSVFKTKIRKLLAD